MQGEVELARAKNAFASGYITSDPVGLDGGPNTYLYARNNSLRWTDPTGLFVPLVPVVAAVVEGVVNTVGAAVVLWTGYKTEVFDPAKSAQMSNGFSGTAANDSVCKVDDGRPNKCELWYNDLIIRQIKIDNNMGRVDDLAKKRWNKDARDYNKECVPKGFKPITTFY